MPLDTAKAIGMGSREEIDAWFREHAAAERELIVAIYNKASGRQTINLGGLQEVATCWGWVDTMTKRIDDERYAVRFVPRRPRSNWTEGNREIARRMIALGRMRPGGFASLPADFQPATPETGGPTPG
jgi:uncharacterized protein YdeI (YjbR/CyaY-like superfamily)